MSVPSFIKAKKDISDWRTVWNENFPSSGEIEVEQRKWHDNFVFIEVEITDMENPLKQTFSANWLEGIKDVNHIHELWKIP